MVRHDIDFKSRSYTHSVGVGDLNGDGFPDLFFANDYANDELFLNKGGATYLDRTDDNLPRQWHGNSGMNGELLDYNNDGLLDIYVTNIYKPPLKTTGNLLWEQTANGQFKVVSYDKGLEKCGFSWAAKFADVDNDGQLDLLVTNGRNRTQSMQSEKDGSSLWYRRTMAGRIPNVLRQFYFQNQLPNEQFYLSAFEEHCLFQKQGEHFVDIAVEAGITDKSEGRGLALADFDNDGRLDFVTANMNQPALLYMNRSQTEGNWLGLELVNRFGSHLPIGARVRVLTRAGTTLYREYYPANGYRAQSDSRLHFGLGGDQVAAVDVMWPAGTSKHYEIGEGNKYVQIRE